MATEEKKGQKLKRRFMEPIRMFVHSQIIHCNRYLKDFVFISKYLKLVCTVH